MKHVSEQSRENMRLAWIERRKRGVSEETKRKQSISGNKRCISRESLEESTRKFKETWAKKRISYVSPHRTKMSDIEYGRELIYRNYKTVGRIKFGRLDLTKEQVNELIIRNCFYCGEPPEERHWRRSRTHDKNYTIRIIANGIDRLDNSKPYTIENSVPCCTTCNFMKRKLSISQFKEKIRKVYTNLWK